MIEFGRVMKQNNIDWEKLKQKEYLKWRSLLAKKTLEIINSASPLVLQKLNIIGCYHRVSDDEVFRKMQTDYRELERVPESWIYQGNFPGIWTALFHQTNTAGFGSEVKNILRIYFQPGFTLFDPENVNQKGEWQNWSNSDSENPWSTLKNDNNKSLEERLKLLRAPSHR